MELVAFWGTVSALLLSWRRKDTRMSTGDILLALRSGSSANNSAGAAIGALGIIIGGIVLSGLGLKFSAILVEAAGGSLLLCVIMVLSLLMAAWLPGFMRHRKTKTVSKLQVVK